MMDGDERGVVAEGDGHGGHGLHTARRVGYLYLAERQPEDFCRKRCKKRCKGG